MIDPERLYHLTHDGAFAEALRLIHAHAEDAAEDPRLARATATFAAAFFAHLGAPAADTPATPDALDPTDADTLETLLLLHAGRLLPLDAARFEGGIARLVRHHAAAGDPATARRYARFCPHVPACAAVLAGAGAAGDGHAGGKEGSLPAPAPVTPSPVAHPWADAVAVTVAAPQAEAVPDATRSLFRSAQEATFFRALRTAFPTYAPLANVALHAVIDLDALGEQITAAERSYGFRALIDAVVCDPLDGYRPAYFFELDSPHHDAPARRARDAMKDRLVTAAGHRLWRLRPAGSPTEAAFVRTLRAVLATKPAD
jgi:hypothetical protein